MYLAGCAGCHGRPGRPARNRITYAPLPEFAHVGTQYSEPELFWVVKHGIRRTGMSAYSSFYSDQQVWQLVEFVRHMDNLPSAVFDAIQPKKAVKQYLGPPRLRGCLSLGLTLNSTRIAGRSWGRRESHGEPGRSRRAERQPRASPPRRQK